MNYRCWAEVDLTALTQNLSWIRHRVGPGVRVITVVKADAYGHGLKHIAARLMQSGTDLFGVAHLGEAQIVKRVGPGWPVLLLGPCLPQEREAAVKEGVMLTVSSEEEARALSAMAVRRERTALVHLKVDTGMGRLGVPLDRAADVYRGMAKLPGLRVVGLYSHFSSVEDDAAETDRQLERFEAVLEALGPERPEWVHIQNSGGVLHGRGLRFSAVRPGLAVYGIVPAGQRRVPGTVKSALRPALSWKARVGFVKTIEPGTALSYGRRFIAPRRMRVATITAGYGDGFMRSGSNSARVLIGGKRCRVLGRVSMDQTLVDVTRVPVPDVGDEVVLIGRQGEAEITATDLAESCGTVAWEVLTNISYRVPRVYRGATAA